MRLLILGGTIFVGRHFAEAAVARGHSITLVHRGERGREVLPDAERILTNRDGGLDALGDRHWDAVIDCCGYVPRVVAQSVTALREKVGRYLFVSTISVYRDSALAGQTEDAELFAEVAPEIETIDGETYGPLKVACERVVREGFGERATIVRPGLIMGPYDPTNRFTYWVDRFARGGEILTPARTSQPMQLIDARDLAEFMLDLVENDVPGTFNACGPDSPVTFADMFDAVATVAAPHLLFPATEAILTEHGVALWQELTLALPEDGSSNGYVQINNQRALDAGLKFRSWDGTAADTLAWNQANPSAEPPRFGLSASKEAEVIVAIKSANV